MMITVTREAVCLADDQLEPMELALEFGADATVEDFAAKLAKSRFLHFSSTCRVLVGRSAKTPLLKIRSHRDSLAVEYLLAADTRLAAVADDAVIHFSFERTQPLRSAQEEPD